MMSVSSDLKGNLTNEDSRFDRRFELYSIKTASRTRVKARPITLIKRSRVGKVIHQTCTTNDIDGCQRKIMNRIKVKILT